MLDLKQSPVNRTIIEVFLNSELQQAVEKTLFDGIARTIELSPGCRYRARVMRPSTPKFT